jgi:F-type H+-transporting ATPase subunit delta
MVVAPRYAKSLLVLALDNGQLENVYADMLMMRDICKSNDDFVNMLENPIIKTDKKQNILREIFTGKIHDLTMKFMILMCEKRREGYLDDIAFAFVEQYKLYKNITTAVITSAAGLEPAAKEKLLGLVKESVTGTVEIEERIDKSLIGGFKIKVGDKQVDASVLRKLNELKKSFAENPFVREF